MNTELTHTVDRPQMIKLFFTVNTLKYIAIVAMAIDHIAYAFVAYDSILFTPMHFIGRITGPTMFYFLVEGYHHTKNVNRYTARLAIFALISYFPFMYFCSGGVVTDLNFLNFNVIYTILMGLLAIRVRRELKNPVLKVFLILCLCLLSAPADWAITGVIIIIVFDYFYGNFNHQAFGYCLVVLLDVGVLHMFTSPLINLIYQHNFNINVEYYQYSLQNFGMFLPIFLLRFYHGQKGKGGKFSKWFFYAFYPLHLLVLGLLQSVIL